MRWENPGQPGSGKGIITMSLKRRETTRGVKETASLKGEGDSVIPLSVTVSISGRMCQEDCTKERDITKVSKKADMTHQTDMRQDEATTADGYQWLLRQQVQEETLKLHVS